MESDRNVESEMNSYSSDQLEKPDPKVKVEISIKPRLDDFENEFPPPPRQMFPGFSFNPYERQEEESEPSPKVIVHFKRILKFNNQDENPLSKFLEQENQENEENSDVEGMASKIFNSLHNIVGNPMSSLPSFPGVHVRKLFLIHPKEGGGNPSVEDITNRFRNEENNGNWENNDKSVGLPTESNEPNPLHSIVSHMLSAIKNIQQPSSTEEIAKHPAMRFFLIKKLGSGDDDDAENENDDSEVIKDKFSTFVPQTEALEASDPAVQVSEKKETDPKVPENKLAAKEAKPTMPLAK